MNDRKILPPTTPAWILDLSGLILLAFALWIELPMWLLLSGDESPSDWSGEYMLALYIGVPCTLLSATAFAVTTTRREWRSVLSTVALAASAILLLAAILAIILHEVS